MTYETMNMRVTWVHNNAADRSSGSFMWDIYDRLKAMEGVDIVLSPIPVVRSARQLSAVIFKGVKHSNAEIVHGQYGALVGFITGMYSRNTRLLSLRGSDIYWNYGSPTAKALNAVRVLMSWIGCFRSDAVVVMSRAMQRRVRAWPFMRDKPVHIIVDPAGEAFWPLNVRSIAPNIKSYSFEVLTASLVDSNPVKRLWIVAEAVRLCQAVGLSVTMNAISGMPREEVKSALERADCISLSSTHEGWPNIIKEALLLGTPFVATNVSDLELWATSDRPNHIAAANPLDFALCWVDQIAASILSTAHIPAELASFHPDVCAIKHQLMYRAYADAKL